MSAYQAIETKATDELFKTDENAAGSSAGSGPIDRGFGIPDRAAKATGGKTATVHVAVGGDPAKAFAEPVADYVIVVK